MREQLSSKSTLIHPQRGATLVEYAMFAVLIAVVCVVTLEPLREVIQGLFITTH
jgi:Flp pilus assembly pilin Flp